MMSSAAASEMASANRRAASKAGSWYDSNPQRLRATLDNWLDNAASALKSNPLFTSFSSSSPSANGSQQQQGLIGVVGPHAGLRFCGETSAHAYAIARRFIHSKQGADVKRIFMIGPSHHKWFEGIQVTSADSYDTPFGPLHVDHAAVAELKKQCAANGVKCSTMSRDTDEDEHSLELHTPFVAHMLRFPPPASKDDDHPSNSTDAAERVKIVPFLISELSVDGEQSLAAALRPFFGKKGNFFVVSTDFCHWGPRFRYTYHYNPQEHPQIGDAITAMDHEGMKHLEANDLNGWYAYLDKTRNTICGRRPLSTILFSISNNGVPTGAATKFVHYSQSNRCADAKDSSVSYASAVISGPLS